MTSGKVFRSSLSERNRDTLVPPYGHWHLPGKGAQTPPQPHLPDVQISTQYFIDMGLRPATAERLLASFLQSVTQYRQTFEFYFRRPVQGGCVPPGYYHDTFVLLYRRTIQSWASQVVSAVQFQLCQTVSSSDLCKQHIDVSLVIDPFPVLFDAGLIDPCGWRYEKEYSF